VRLEKAIEELGASDRVNLSYRPHVLYPDVPAEGKDVSKSKARKERARTQCPRTRS